MIVNAKPETETLTSLRKAAMLLIVLGEQSSAEPLHEKSIKVTSAPPQVQGHATRKLVVEA